MKSNDKYKAKAQGPLSARSGFTLVELLVVISVIAVLAAFTIPALSSAFRAQKISHAQGELAALQSVLERYKAKYGIYPPSGGSVMTNQLYFELVGTTTNASGYQTLDGGYTISPAEVQSIFGVGGFINCSNGTSSEDAVRAENFLTELKSTQVAAITNNNILVPFLVTSVGGPDATYHPLSSSVAGNPFRYQYPGVHNPNSYDLWIQLSIGSKFANNPPATNFYLVCNWAQQAHHNDFSAP